MAKLWLKAAAVRAVKTMAQTGIAMIGTSTFVEELNWPQIASAVLVAGILSILTSVAGLPEVDPAEAEDAYTDDETPITMEELDELDNDTEEEQ